MTTKRWLNRKSLNNFISVIHVTADYIKNAIIPLLIFYIINPFVTRFLWFPGSPVMIDTTVRFIGFIYFNLPATDIYPYLLCVSVIHRYRHDEFKRSTRLADRSQHFRRQMSNVTVRSMPTITSFSIYICKILLLSNQCLSIYLSS